ncbi:MAG: CBS domain-containing protein, partial [Burkholderiaceae bacterium]|nr:CBS domain-containing protein [Burkholderiaceae bacterium]
MTVVAAILKSKPEGLVHSIAPTATVLQALQTMAERRIGALLVMQDNAIVGILTERDYARKIALMGRSSVSTLVS